MTAFDSSRRRFLTDGGTAVVATWAATSLPGLREALAHARRVASQPTAPPFEFLTPAQGADIEAMAAQIWPTDDMPGAREAGVVHFIDHALATDPVALPMRPLFTTGVEQLQAKVGELYPGTDTRFAALAGERQMAVLRAIESTPFFDGVRTITMLALFANPSYGANPSGQNWAAIGFEPRFVWRPPFGAYDRDAHAGEGQ
ncbi:MAG TPA: gluconate 2-dehydrogenase subunit 3 family protein [Gemmatimonadales bacterium]|nr:gluconate 2-dehydrogenase subunit 3 family protein [Gemmatimonadales bacterium]